VNSKKVYYGTLLGALVFGLLSGVVFYLVSETTWIWKSLLGLAGALFLAHLILNISNYRQTLNKRTTQMGVRAVVNGILVVGIIVILNMIVINHDFQTDITKNKIHTLSEQTTKVIRGLQNEVVLKAFVNPTQIPELDSIFSKYTHLSKKLKREFVDVDKDPLIVQKYNIRSAGTVIVESGDRNVRIENLSGPEDPKLEEKLTNAIIAATKGGKKKLYYLSGHGERLLSDNSRDGFSEMKEALESSRYEVEELIAMEKGEIPNDAELVVIAGPKSEFMPQEYRALEKYVQSGGKLFIMLEPVSPSSMRDFLLKYGADWKPKKVILETNSLQQLAGGNPLTPIVTTYDKTHEITREAKQLSLFPISTPVEKATKIPEGEEVVSLLSSSARSLETDLKGDKVRVNQATDRKGPLSLALAIRGSLAGKETMPTQEKKENQKEFRIVVVGDADFASNSARQFGMNADLFQNMLSWLAQEEDLIAIRPRSTAESKFDITEQRIRVINLASVVIAPLLMFVSGIWVWLCRRRR